MPTLALPPRADQELLDAHAIRDTLGLRDVNHVFDRYADEIVRDRTGRRYLPADLVDDYDDLRRDTGPTRPELLKVVTPPRDSRRGPAPETRYPLRPLRMLLERDGIERTDSDLADILGVARTTISRWRWEGIPETTADRLAIRAGWHPCLVWGDDWWTQAIDASIERHPSSRPTKKLGSDLADVIALPTTPDMGTRSIGDLLGDLDEAIAHYRHVGGPMDAA